MFCYVSQQLVEIGYPPLVFLIVGEFDELRDGTTFLVLLLWEETNDFILKAQKPTGENYRKKAV